MTNLLIIEVPHQTRARVYEMTRSDFINLAHETGLRNGNYSYTEFSREYAEGCYGEDIPPAMLALFDTAPVVVEIIDAGNVEFFAESDPHRPSEWEWAWETMTHDYNHARVYEIGGYTGDTVNGEDRIDTLRRALAETSGHQAIAVLSQIEELIEEER